MEKENISQQQLVARDIASKASFDDRQALQSWIKSLLDIRDSELTPKDKVKRALRATASQKVAWPMIKLISKEIKRHGWDNRRKSARYGILGSAAGVALFGGASAGIAALGGAVGVPLWVVLGAGATFARTLYDALSHDDQ